LLDLPYGAHNITFYATDLAGNTGASETVYFTVSKPFPTAVLASSVIIIVVAGLAVLIYFAKLKKRKTKAGV
jgi:F0F1-type ATP synthase membrane subunit a